MMGGVEEGRERVIALAGNPNVGKSTLFNALTGMRQHTGNWAGKTVEIARGRCTWEGESLSLIDLPGTYSLAAHSAEEEVARDYLQSGAADATVVVCDATCLERNLGLVLQTLKLTPRVVVCVNLMDEAGKKGIAVDLQELSLLLGVPVVGTAAGSRRGVDALLRAAVAVAGGPSPAPAAPLAAAQTPEEMIRLAERLASACVRCERADYARFDRRLDRILTGRRTAIPVMMLLLTLVFWITLYGANLPSQLLEHAFAWLGVRLERLLLTAGAAPWLRGILTDGVYRVLTWVVAVMLPPMAIFFPLFTILEDFGYLPRVAFVLDHAFERVGACGKQALTLCMGLGCNAVGVTGCRIIDSPRERLLAILTNSLVPCNGRFPTLIAISLMFFAGAAGPGGPLAAAAAALALTATILLGVGMTFLASKLLTATVLKGAPSFFTLELPPYRRPRVGQVVVRSLFDRTIYVLGRAVAVAAPAGLVIWAVANLRLGEVTVLARCVSLLDPFARLLGLDGVILLAFLLGFPANEIVMPLILMGYLAAGTLVPVGDIESVRGILTANGWTMTTAVCTALFTLFHWPCSTTCLTVWRETRSAKWTALAFLVPTAVGFLLCALTATIVRFLT